MEVEEGEDLEEGVGVCTVATVNKIPMVVDGIKNQSFPASLLGPPDPLLRAALVCHYSF